MTDDDILKQAEEIKARRARAELGREFMEAERVQLVIWPDTSLPKRIDVPVGPELAAFLCQILQCDITEK